MGSPTKPVHKHLIVRAEVTEPFVDPKVAVDWVRRLIDRIGMDITEHGGPHCDYVKKEGNCGIACVAIIETSHVALHIWDQAEPPLAQLDVYSCSDYLVEDVLGFVREMSPTKLSYRVLDRGTDLRECYQGGKVKALSGTRRGLFGWFRK